MRILIDIGHPGDFYLFKNFAIEMEKKGNAVIFTVREGENETSHLNYFGFRYYRIGKKRTNIISKILSIPFFTLQILLISLRFRPTHLISHGSIYAGIAAFILRKPHIAMEDTGNMEMIRLSRPFSNVILSTDVLPIDLGKKHIRYKGYHELCYLLPKYFTPNKDIFEYLGISENTPYVILRFVSWNASHDLGQRGISEVEKLDLVKFLSNKIKVFISAEKFINKELESFRINIPVYKMHDALAFANLYIGEGATMAAEAGVLGTPSIYISTINICYTRDQEKYGTVFNFNKYCDAKNKIEQLLSNKSIKDEFLLKRQNLIKDKIDVTAFLVWFVENWPQSFKVIKEYPDFPNNFG